MFSAGVFFGEISDHFLLLQCYYQVLTQKSEPVLSVDYAQALIQSLLTTTNMFVLGPINQLALPIAVRHLLTARASFQRVRRRATSCTCISGTV